MMESLLRRLSLGEDISAEEVRGAFGAIFDGRIGDEAIAEFLRQLRDQPLKTEYLTAAATALRERMTPLDYPGMLMDSCGTGGDHQGTINISTVVAVVLAGAGIKVAKHGNRAVSSTSGSSDVLSLLGVQVNLSPASVRTCLEETNLGFCFAPRFHPCLKRLAPIRRQLGFPTILNLLGPLANPARTAWQLVGVGQVQYQEAVAGALHQLGVSCAAVVHGAPGLDEVSLAGRTEVRWLEDGKMTATNWLPQEFGHQTREVQELHCSSAQESAQRIWSILEGEPDPALHWILANAAAGLLITGRIKYLQEGVQLAQEVIRSGQARETFGRLAALSQRLKED